MNKKFFRKGIGVLASSIIGIGLSVSSVQAAIVSVAGGTSTLGATASIIAAPSDALDSTVTNSAQQGFDEMQGVILGSALSIDGGGTIAAGTRVDSHMIFLNISNNISSAVYHNGVRWGFSGNILGVMSDSGGTLEAASTATLGAAGTNYPGAGFAARGMEGADGYIINGAFLTVDMGVTQPGDWIRVVTVSAIPLPAALPLYAAGVVILGYLGWRRKRATS